MELKLHPKMILKKNRNDLEGFKLKDIKIIIPEERSSLNASILIISKDKPKPHPQNEELF